MCEVRLSQKNGILYTQPELSEDPTESVKYLGCVSSREPAIKKLVRETIEKFDIKDDFELIINCADKPLYTDLKNHYGFVIDNDRFEKGFPDNMFCYFYECGLTNYTEIVNSFIDSTPSTNKIGWVGVLAYPEEHPRQILYNLSKKLEFLEVIEMGWGHIQPDMYKYAMGYMSYQDQIDRWKYLIDLEGNGWSGRLKVLFSTPRITFMVDRPYQEYWFEHLVPWKHYVPVKRDLSDLEENYNLIENDVELQNHIKNNVKKFSETHLTLDAAHNRVRDIINENILR